MIFFVMEFAESLAIALILQALEKSESQKQVYSNQEIERVFPSSQVMHLVHVLIKFNFVREISGRLQKLSEDFHENF